MKNFRKTKNELFICEECGRLCKNLKGLSTHIRYSHNKKYKEYYNKWVKEDNEGICKICGKETEFTGFKRGYKNCCSKECSNKYMHKQIEISNLKKYGVKSTRSLKNTHNKRKETCKKIYRDENYNNMEKNKETCLKNYGYISGFCNIIKRKETKLERHGDENYNNMKKTKQTKKEKYGDEYYNNREKAKQTCLEKWGVDNPAQASEVKEKMKQTNLENLGVEYPMQNKEILEKSYKSALTLNQFKDKNLWYQGTYELDFLEKYYLIYPDIQRGPLIPYNFEEKSKIYHPDFYIPSLNLIVEIKSTWTYNPIIDPIKEKAAIENDFNYIMIVNKNYKNFIF